MYIIIWIFGVIIPLIVVSMIMVKSPANHPSNNFRTLAGLLILKPAILIMISYAFLPFAFIAPIVALISTFGLMIYNWRLIFRSDARIKIQVLLVIDCLRLFLSLYLTYVFDWYNNGSGLVVAFFIPTIFAALAFFLTQVESTTYKRKHFAQ